MLTASSLDPSNVKENVDGDIGHIVLKKCGAHLKQSRWNLGTLLLFYKSEVSILVKKILEVSNINAIPAAVQSVSLVLLFSLLVNSDCLQE